MLQIVSATRDIMPYSERVWLEICTYSKLNLHIQRKAAKIHGEMLTVGMKMS